MLSALMLSPCALSAPPPAISQYVEIIPTSTGGTPAGIGKGRGGSLPSAVEKGLRHVGAADAQVLHRLSTQLRYGAPGTRKHGVGKQPGQGGKARNQGQIGQGQGTPSAPDVPSVSAVQALGTALGSHEDKSLLVLFGLLIGVMVLRVVSFVRAPRS